MRFAVPLLPPDAASFDVVAFGQNSVDIVAEVAEYPEPDSKARLQSLRRFTGGEMATAAIACRRLDCRTRYVGAVGMDPGGEMVVSALSAEGVDVASIRRVDAPTRTAIILVDRSGRRTVLWSRDDALNGSLDTADLEAVASGRILIIDASDPAASCAAAREARRKGIATIVDVDEAKPGIEPLLKEIDVLIAPGQFARTYTGASSDGEALRRLSVESAAALTVTTHGAEGALARYDGHDLEVPAYAIDVVDTTGAGDAFRGGFAAAWVRSGGDADVAMLLRTAAAVAALNCRAMGAQTGLPRWSDVDVLVTGGARARSN